MITALVWVSKLILFIVAGAILYGLFSHDPWYRCFEFAAIVGGAGLGFQWLSAAREKELAQESAWLALRTLVLKSEEMERFKAAYSTRNPEEVQRAKEEVLAAIRSLQ